MRKLSAYIGAFFGALFSAGLAFGVMPGVPSNPNFSDPSQLINTLNTLMSTMGGASTLMNNNTPVIYSMGQFCSASGATPQTCNGQRGLVTTASLSTAAATNANYVINNSLVNAGSTCTVQVVSYSGTLVTNGYPIPMVAAPGAGTLTISLTNTHAANALSGTVGLAFNCFN